jgi:hypothetical protein
MSKFRHPHLVRGILHTPAGAFEVRRGIVDAPDALGEQFGWPKLEESDLFVAPSTGPGPRSSTIAARTEIARRET